MNVDHAVHATEVGSVGLEDVLERPVVPGATMPSGVPISAVDAQWWNAIGWSPWNGNKLDS